MDQGGVEGEPSHKSIGDQSGKRSSCTCKSRRCGPSPYRFNDCLFVHPQAGRNKKFNPQLGGLSPLERSAVKKVDNLDSSLDQHQGKLSRRFPEQTQPGSMGVSVIKRNVHVCAEQVQPETHHGRVCQQPDQAAGQIHESVPRPSSCSQRCSNQPMGPSVVSFPSGPSDYEVSAENTVGEVGGRDDRSSVAILNMVASTDQADGEAIPEVAVLQNHSDNDGRESHSPLPGPSGSCTSQGVGEERRILLLNSDDQSLQTFLSHHLTSGTSKTYKCSFAKFTKFCSNLGVSAVSCGPDIIVQYIKSLFDSGASYNTVNHSRSAISKFHEGFNGVNAGCHKLVCIAVKAVFKQRPPIPKYLSTFDINIVFNYIKTLPPNQELSLKLLTFKALFLLTASSISRMSSVKQLGPAVTVYKVINYFSQ